MNLKTWQIIAIFLLVFFHFNNDGGSIFPKPYVPDLADEELESKVFAGMLVLHSNNIVTPNNNSGQVGSIEPEIVKEIEPTFNFQEEKPKPIGYVWEGRHNRVILLTDTKRCLPCIKADNEIVKVLEKNKVWKVGKDNSDALQVIDLSKDPALFWKTVEILKNIEKTETNKDLIHPKLINYSPMTPTFIKIDENGIIKDIQVGLTTMKQFSDFLEKNKIE